MQILSGIIICPAANIPAKLTTPLFTIKLGIAAMMVEYLQSKLLGSNRVHLLRFFVTKAISKLQVSMSFEASNQGLLDRLIKAL